MGAGKEVFLGIDLGTTNIKAQMVSEEGTTLSSCSLPVGISYGAEGGAEQDIEEIWSRTKEAIRMAVDAAPGGRCRAIGVSSQGGALQILDGKGKASGRVIGWQDSRGDPWNRKLTQRFGSSWFAEHTGSSGSSSAIGQISRLREAGSLPRNFSVGWVGDILIGRLCGNRAEDATSLSEAGLFNPRTGREDEEILRLLDIDSSRLPSLIDATSPAGSLLPELAAELGLPQGILVGPAVHDQYAAALGCGAVRAGDTMLGAGTAWVILAISDRLEAPVGGIALAGRHPVPGLFGQMLSMINGGACISWTIKTLRLTESGVGDLDALLSSVPSGCAGLRFRPLLSEMSAHGLPQGSSGRIDGLHMGHGPAHIVRAMVEGLACELGRHLRLLREGGVEVERIVMCGKAASSLVTPQIIADTTGLPVACSQVPETSSLGAAMLARSLVEPTMGLINLSEAMKPSLKTVEPGVNREEACARLEEYLTSLS